MADVSVHEVAGGAGEGLWCRMKAPPTPEEARDTDGREEATDIDSFTENEMFFLIRRFSNFWKIFVNCLNFFPNRAVACIGLKKLHQIKILLPINRMSSCFLFKGGMSLHFREALKNVLLL